MSLDTWWLFFVAYLVITLAPGPNLLFVVKNALQHSYAAALASILGNLSCQLMIILFVALGAGALLAQSPLLFLGLKISGGCYLIYLGFYGLLAKREVPKERGAPQTNKEHLSGVSQVGSTIKLLAIYRKGFLVSASNPKTVIFLSAFLPQFTVAQTSLFQQFSTMFLTISLTVILVHLGYAYVASYFEKRLLSSWLKTCFGRVYNSVFVVFGGLILLENKIR